MQFKTLFVGLVAVLCVQTGQAQAQSLLDLNTLDSLIETEYERANYKKAINYAQAALDRVLKERGEADSAYLQYLNNIAVLYHENGQYKEAEQAYLQLQTNWDKVFGAPTLELSNVFNNLAILYQEAQGNYEKAEHFFLKAQALLRQWLGEENLSMAQNFNNLGTLYYDQELYERAEPLYLQTIALKRKLLGDKHLSLAISISNLGSLYKDMQLYDQAIDLFLQALAQLDNQQSQYVTSINSLAEAYRMKGDFANAERYLMEIKDLSARLYGKSHPRFADKINNLAKLYAGTPDYERAEPLYKQTLAIYTQALGDKHPSVASVLQNLGYWYAKAGRLDSALHYARAAIKANSSTIKTDWDDWEELSQHDYFSNQTFNASIQLLLSIYNQQGDKTALQSAYQVVQAALGLNATVRHRLDGEQDKLRNLQHSHRLCMQGLELSLHLGYSPQEAFVLSETGKGVLLMEAANAERAYSFGAIPDSLIQTEKDLQTEYSRLKSMLLEQRSAQEQDSLRNRLNALIPKMEQFRQQLKKQYPLYAELKNQDQTVQAEAVQKALDGETALLEYALLDSALCIFYMDNNQCLLSSRALSKDILKQKIQQLHQALSDYALLQSRPEEAYELYGDLAHWFYKQLIPDILQQKQAPNIQHLVIIPDGELGHLPFESFLAEPAPEGGNFGQLHYLLRDFKISYAYSATLSIQNQNKLPSSSGKLLAMAADYDLPSDSLSGTRLPSELRLRSMLDPLPAARREVQTLSEQFEGEFLLDSAANEAAFKQHSQGFGILHLAMHGILDRKNPALSSLAFSENGDSAENNFLQAYEISKLQIPANLVVLSACETGYGRFEQGNGTASLARAFFYAGVPAMVVSLWEVNDASTAGIMLDFYKNLSDGQDKAQALRQAKLRYLQQAKGSAAHPAYWSAFVLMGDSGPITVDVRSSGWIWWLLLAVLGISIAMVGWLIVRRRA